MQKQTRNRPKGQATSYQVAKLAGVSQSAVSRCFKPGASVSKKMRTRIMKAVEDLGYRPNAIARSLISKRSNMVGIVMADVRNPFYPAALDIFVRKLQEQGQKSMLLMASRDQQIDVVLPQLLEYQVDGVVITSATLSSDMADLCVEMGIPVVLFNRYVPDTQANSICCDNARAARRVADFLVETGHRRLAYIAGVEDTSTNRDREEAFRSQISKNKLAAPISAVGNYTYDGGFDAALTLLAGKEKPEAIFCANDIMAMGAMDALRYKMGINIPDDVSIIGFDDIENAQWPTYDLTTVRQPVQRMVERTISNLLERAESPSTPQVTELLDGELIVRGSTR